MTRSSRKKKWIKVSFWTTGNEADVIKALNEAFLIANLEIDMRKVKPNG